ncbi:MAG TPA: hypothetical protein VIR60_00675, partial [Gammaproteobacteria bacterium]
MTRRCTTLLLGCSLATAGGFCAAAEDGFPSVEFHGLVDARVIAADAERNWLDGEFGKTRYGDGDASTRLRL